MSHPELHPGDVVAGHRIDAVAGRGGMGVVYRATALDLGRTVALKLIAPALASDPAFRERFIRETRVAASIDHPNVIPLFSAGEEHGRLYIAMRYVDGDDLRTLVRGEGRLAPARAAHVVAQVAAALDAAHARGIVHRDVKPANVLLAPGDHAYLTDFGLARRIDSASGMTRAGGWVGTLGYVPPEQIRGERLDARADVYALGCVLFHALTGTPPYARESDEATLWAHLNAPPPAVTQTVPGVPAAFDAVLARALAKAPADRFPSAGDLGRAALGAAGLAPAPVPERERVVATGAAAPLDDETVISPPAATGPAEAPPTAATTPVARAAEPGPPGTAPGGGRGAGAEPVGARRPARTGRRAAVLAGLVALLAAGGAGAALLSGGDADEAPVRPGAQARTATARTAAAPAPEPREPAEVVEAVAAGSRPNALVATRRAVFVASFPDARLTLVDPRTNQRQSRGPTVGLGAQALAAGFDSLWVAKARTQSLLRYDLASRRRVGGPAALPPGAPVRVAVGEGSVWVGVRSRFGVDTVARFRPGAATPQAVIEVPRGVQDLAVGAGAVWVTARRGRSLTRIDVATGARRNLPVGGNAAGVVVSGRYVWVALPDEDLVTRVRTSGRYATAGRERVGDAPRFLDAGGGAIWVSNELDDSLTRLDPRTGKTVETVEDVVRNPRAVSVRGTTAWVASADAGTVTRVDFARTRPRGGG